MEQNCLEQRRDVRVELDSYHCVEVQTLTTLFKYQFKIWNISSHGACLLVRSDSDFLDKVAVGEILEINYFPTDLSWPPDVRRTQIRHITRTDQEKFKDHFLVGLMVLNDTP